MLHQKSVFSIPDVQTHIHEVASVPTLECIPSQTLDLLESCIKVFFPNTNVINISRFVQSYMKIILIRDTLTSTGYRGEDNADCQVKVRTLDGSIAPAFVRKIYCVQLTLDDNTEEVVEVFFIKADVLKEHANRYWFGENCPMELWSTEISSSIFVPLCGVIKKCCLTKGKQYFDRLSLGNGKQSQYKTFDMVYYVI